jgi:hypothetical protein
MDRDEATARKAEHKAAALHYLGWETGAGATVWARAVRDGLAQHEEARARYAAGGTNISVLERREMWERLHATVLTLVVAIDQVLTYEQSVRSLTGDAELQRARERAEPFCRDAGKLRDLVLHLNKYAVGSGWRQTGHGNQPQLFDKYLSTFAYWTNGGGTQLELGGHHMNLRDAASAAIELAEVVERVRATHLERTEQEANAALRRSRGLPPGRSGTASGVIPEHWPSRDSYPL